MGRGERSSWQKGNGVEAWQASAAAGGGGGVGGPAAAPRQCWS